MSLTKLQGQLVSNTTTIVSNVVTANSFIGSGALLSNITNASLVNTSITINGTTIALGGSGSIIAGATITDDNSTNATRYVMLGTETNGAYIVANTSSSKLLFNPSSGTLSTSNIAIGKTTANVSLDLSAKSDAIWLPKGTVAQRPSSPQDGYLRYNTEVGCPEYYSANTATWTLISGSTIIATGGTITQSGNYKIHTFTSSGTFTITSGIGPIDVLIVAGGGGAGGGKLGCHGGGGGGAGGVVLKTGLFSTPGSFSVTVGTGGSGQNTQDSGTAGGNGGNSTFSSYTAIGGGGGGPTLTGNGSNGGSGGGGSRHDNTNMGGSGLQPASASGGYGNNGGRTGPTNTGPGGGGGAGGAGSSGDAGGAGGAGLQFTQFGTSTYFGAGGNAGGAAGASGQTAGGTNGAANSGAGGGGAGGGQYKGNGGSGVVIVRYLSV